MLSYFKTYLIEEGKSENTVKSYCIHVNQYLKWYHDSFGIKFCKLYRENVLEFKSYLYNVKNQSAKTINAKLSALAKLNEFLVAKGIQDKIVITKKDMIKIQAQGTNPTDISKKDVEKFRQQVLENEGIRNYAIVTIMAYCGTRISETLDIKLSDINLTTREIIIRQGKGNKQRIAYMNDKVVNAIKGYLKERKETDKGYLFISNKGNKLDRTVINKMFNKYSDVITPHQLRHFFCTNALENGFSVHEVAYLAGHSNVHTTLLYTNPNKVEMKHKVNKL